MPPRANRTNHHLNMVNAATSFLDYKLDNDEKQLLAKVIGEYLELVAEKKRADELERVRVALDIRSSLKTEKIVLVNFNLERRAIAKQVTDRMTSVAERMLGL